MSLRDRVYIVTGGSRGFGFAIAKSLIGQGARVALVSRDQSGLDAAVTELGTECAIGIAADVANSQQVSEAFAHIKAHYGRLDGLINNAGMARPNPVEKLVEAEVMQQVQTNFLGTVFCSQAVIPLLRGAENPRIINISSASAWHYDEMSHLSIYAATKAAVERFSRDMALELAGDGIGVSCIRPGAAWTSFADDWESDAFEAGLEAWQHAGTYMNTGMDVSQVGDSVVYALSQPVGVAVDLLEIRPNIPTEKVKP
jgi:NAD(P)-dependent dehydrogenase (short-subunit alcohol dehydrogenase family)